MNPVFRSRAVLVVGLLSVLCVTGCDGATEEADSQLQQMQRGDAETAAFLREHGWELLQDGQRWTARFNGKPLTDEMLVQLRNFQQLVGLDVSGVPLTNEQMKLVAEFHHLLSLNLSGTGIGDAEFQLLDEMFLLTELNLEGTNVTSAATKAWLLDRKANEAIMQMFKNTRIIGVK